MVYFPTGPPSSEGLQSPPTVTLWLRQHRWELATPKGQSKWKQCQTLFWGAPKSLRTVTAALKLKDAYSLEGK